MFHLPSCKWDFDEILLGFLGFRSVHRGTQIQFRREAHPAGKHQAPSIKHQILQISAAKWHENLNDQRAISKWPNDHR